MSVPQKTASTPQQPIPGDGPDSLYPPMPACPLACDADGPPLGSTVPFDTKHATGSDDLPLHDPLLARRAGLPAGAPDQIKVQLAVDGGVVVSWVTGETAIGKAPELQKKIGGGGGGDEPPPPSVVKFGKSPEALDRHATSPSDPIVVPGSPDGGADGAVGGLLGARRNNKTGSSSSSPMPPQPRRYVQSYPMQAGGSHSYLSGWNHHVLLRSPSQIIPERESTTRWGRGPRDRGGAGPKC